MDMHFILDNTYYQSFSIKDKRTDDILGSCRHNWTAFSSTVFCDGAIKHVDLIEEVNSYKKAKQQLP